MLRVLNQLEYNEELLVTLDQIHVHSLTVYYLKSYHFPMDFMIPNHFLNLVYIHNLFSGIYKGSEVPVNGWS